MRYLVLRLKSSLCLCLALLPLLPIRIHSQPFTMTAAALADFRLYLDFSASTYASSPDRQQEIRRGIDLGMRMWQSVLPGLHYQWMATAAEANLQLKFGNYTSNRPCADGTAWSACATVHVNGALPPGAAIWFNDAGKPVGGSNIPPFTFDQYSHVSRSELFAGYSPATKPPEGYTSTNPGNYVGLFRPLHLGASDDISTVFFHEFAHVLGMNHFELSSSQVIGWYRKPRMPNGAQPLQPAINIHPGVHPGLPSNYYPNYFGCGEYDVASGQVTLSCTGDMDELHTIMYNHHHDYIDVPGIPLPPIFKFNNRVVYPADLSSSLMPAYSWSYPKINGVIVLEQPSTGYYFYTSDWSVAISKAQLNRVGQPDRWFVKDVLIGASLRHKIAAGHDHVLAIRNNGTVWAWGRNNLGQLGRGNTSTTPVTSPVQVTGLSGVFTSVAAGASHSVALKSDGTLWAWGGNSYGQLGINSTQNRSTPVQVCGISGPSCFGNRYVAVAAGWAHTLAIRDDGTLWSWGYNGEGQLGHNHSNKYLPQMEYWGNNDWISISAGTVHSLGIRAGGPANGWGWGSGYRGQTGLDFLGNTYYPSQVWSPMTWRYFAVGGGADFSLAQNLDGTLWAWGDNTAGQLGRNVSEMGYSMTPIAVQGEGGATNWTRIARGNQHAGGVKLDGRLWTWGSNSNGQLGRGAIANTGVPGQVSGNRTDWVSLTMGASSSFAFRRDGSLWAWGNNQYGQLGTGNTTSSNLPMASKFGDVPTVNLHANWVDHFNHTNKATAPGNIQVIRRLNSSDTGFIGATFDLKSSAYGNFPQVEFRNGSSILGSDNTAPYAYSWSAPSAGRFSLNARVTDRMNTVVTSPTLTVDVFQQGERFRSPPTTSVNLQTEGSLDWMHWGRSGTSRTEKSGSSIISLEPTSFPMSRFSSSSSSMPGFSWNNGTAYNPTSVGQSRTGVYLEHGNAFAFSIAASTTLRTLQIWFRVRNAKISTTAFFETENSNLIDHVYPSAMTGTDQYLVYEMTYAVPSGSGNIKLVFQPYEVAGGGNVVIQAIAVK